MNRQLAERLLSKVPEKVSEKVSEKKAEEGSEDAGQNPLGDQRFAAMFSNPDFEVDAESEEYLRLHPVLSHRDKKQQERRDRAAAMQEEGEEEVRERWGRRKEGGVGGEGYEVEGGVEGYVVRLGG